MTMALPPSLLLPESEQTPVLVIRPPAPITSDVPDTVFQENRRSMNNQFRKKPVVIEAVQLRWDTWQEMCEHAGVGKLSDGKPEGFWPDGEGRGRIGLHIPTLEGLMEATEGDWIIRGIKGELYPCKPDIFAATYEAMSGASSVIGEEGSDAPKTSPVPAPSVQETRPTNAQLDAVLDEFSMSKYASTAHWNESVIYEIAALRASVASKEIERPRHIGYAKYVPTQDEGSLLVCCAPDEQGAFRIFRKPGDLVHSTPDAPETFDVPDRLLLAEIRERLQNSVNWMMEGRKTGLCPGVADFRVLIQFIDAAGLKDKA